MLRLSCRAELEGGQRKKRVRSLSLRQASEVVGSVVLDGGYELVFLVRLSEVCCGGRLRTLLLGGLNELIYCARLLEAVCVYVCV